MTNILMNRLDLDHPIIQAPMAGGGDTAEMVIAAGEAGALGSLGCAYRSPDQIREVSNEVSAGTNRGFGVNLFAPMPVEPPPPEMSAALAFIAPFYDELGLDTPAAPASGGFDFDAQVEEALASGATVFSFTFGIMTAEIIAAAKARNMVVMGTATTVPEAIALEEAGVDAVVAQGSEAGGHRGTFLGDFDKAMIGTAALVPQVADAVAIPVVASGGIADGRGIAAALALGASAVQIGTAFLTCAEAGIPDAYKQAILDADPADTKMTRAFSGRPARGVINRFMRETEADRSVILPFPYQNALTRPMRAAGGGQGKAEYLSLWAGQGLGLNRRQTTAELIERLVAETREAYSAPD